RKPETAVHAPYTICSPSAILYGSASDGTCSGDLMAICRVVSAPPRTAVMSSVGQTRPFGQSTECPLCPRKRALRGHHGTSESCQKETSACASIGDPGTYAPVEEPATASLPDLFVAPTCAFGGMTVGKGDCRQLQLLASLNRVVRNCLTDSTVALCATS